MREQRKKPVDVSKALFMDLAFLLIAALVLLVNEPRELPAKDVQDLLTVEYRSSVSREVKEVSMPGESLYIEIQRSGKLYELLSDGSASIPLDIKNLASRIERMKQRPRVIVLVPAVDAPYGVIASVRDELEVLMAKEKVSRIVELVKGEVE